ncbi:MAG: sulfite exporter TauE/SafE family protein [Candidatus Omnitrophota bacterium]|jgi:sulfite exporter TauE/SafE
MIRIILEGLMLGLSAGIYCVGACLVFFMPYLLVEGKQKIFENLRKILSFMLGRLIAYIAFALIIGFLGSSYQNIFTVRFSYICLIVASLLMLFYSLAHNFRDSRFCVPFINRFSLMRIPFFLGLFTGLNPCPPFLVGATRLWTLNSILGGVILFIAFFIGTSVYMIPLIFISYFNKSERIKQIGLMVALLSSLWFLFVGISGLIH